MTKKIFFTPHAHIDKLSCDVPENLVCPKYTAGVKLRQDLWVGRLVVKIKKTTPGWVTLREVTY